MVLSPQRKPHHKSPGANEVIRAVEKGTAVLALKIWAKWTHPLILLLLLLLHLSSKSVLCAEEDAVVEPE